MLLRVAELKCHNCGRTRGKIVAPTVGGLDVKATSLRAAARSRAAGQRTSPRCRHCGGLLYVDEPFSVRSGELSRLVDIPGRPVLDAKAA